MSLTFNYKFLLKWIFLLHYFLSSLIFPSFFSIFILLCQAVLWVFPFPPCFKYCIGILRLLSVMMRVLLRVLLLLSLQSCPTLCDPRDGSPPGSQSLGFSRQEHWSGLPFPSPMHETKKWKWSRSVGSDSERSHGLQPTRLLHPWDFPGKSTGVGCHCLLWRVLHIPLKVRRWIYYLYISRNEAFSVSSCLPRVVACQKSQFLSIIFKYFVYIF